MKPFLLLATRADDAIADAEYRQFLRFGRLAPEQLVRVRLESAPLSTLLPSLDLTAFSGVITGGSPFTASDPDSSKSQAQLRVERELPDLLDAVLKHDVPFLGACYGISTLGMRVGGTVDRRFGEPVGATEIRLSPAGLADPLLAGVRERFMAFVGHKEALRENPPGATLLASSEACPVQMFRVGERQYATQFHPELDVPGIIERMHAYKDAGYFRPDELEVLIAHARASTVRFAATVLANFTARHAR